MRKVMAILLVLVFAAPAGAAIDLGNGRCFDEGQDAEGVWNGTLADDAGCITEAEYEEMFSASNLLEVGVIEGYEVHGNGTTTLDFGGGIKNTVKSNPLDRPVAANPELEPDAPTVREVLFPGSRFYPQLK